MVIEKRSFKQDLKCCLVIFIFLTSGYFLVRIKPLNYIEEKSKEILFVTIFFSILTYVTININMHIVYHFNFNTMNTKITKHNWETLFHAAGMEQQSSGRQLNVYLTKRGHETFKALNGPLHITMYILYIQFTHTHIYIYPYKYGH